MWLLLHGTECNTRNISRDFQIYATCFKRINVSEIITKYKELPIFTNIAWDNLHV